MYMYNVLLFYTTYISADLAHHDTFRAKFDKGGINIVMQKKSQFSCLAQFAYMPSGMAMASRRGCRRMARLSKSLFADMISTDRLLV